MSKKSIELLNKAVADEIQAVHQYEKFGEQFLALQSIERSKSLAGGSQEKP